MCGVKALARLSVAKSCIYLSFLLLIHISLNASTSYNCIENERLFQFDNFEIAGPHICDPSTIWRLAQLHLPDAKVFLDVGGNLGYTAAHIFELWSPGHGFNRVELRIAVRDAISRNITTNHDQYTTHCKDGNSVDAPYTCVGQPAESRLCQFRRDISVFSFDGQLEHVQNQRKIIYEYFPHLHPEYAYNHSNTHVKGMWEYIHGALTDVLPHPGATGKFMQNKQELGTLAVGRHKIDPSMLVDVPLLTIDSFCDARNITSIDILKTDTEGHDMYVILGAHHTLLHRGVKMIVLECVDCSTIGWDDFYHTLDTKYGFDCYLYGINNMAIRMTNCWNYNMEIKRPPCGPNNKCPGYMRFHGKSFWRKALDGNAYCFHRDRAPGLLQVVDNLSLHHYASDKRGDFHKDALLGVSAGPMRHSEHREGRWKWSSERAQAHYATVYGRDTETGEKTFWKRFEK
ncbi:FkbM family methyltransferase [archaeon]|nr:MAG: FkbM family methyltransferase [archaeon]